MATTDSPIIYALDFDGVICDSVGESSETGLRSAKAQWPHLNLEPPFADHMLNAMATIRPVVETGYENVLLARLVATTTPHTVDADFVQPVLNDWANLRENVMAEWNVSNTELVDVFGRVRDEWIERDQSAWASANRIFPGVVDALNFATAPVFIVTTKQTRFVQLLLKANGIARIPDDRIYGLGTGTKTSALKSILALPHSKGKSICFVEDRYETLEAVSLSMLGQPLQLFLASWGYNTEATQAVAQKHPFIHLLDLPTFVHKLQ